MTTKNPTNIHLLGSEHGHVALCCDYDGAGYHVWVDRHNYLPDDSTLFKNPPLGCTREQDYPTRSLDQNGALGRKIVPVMLAAIPTIAPAFEKRIKDEIARKEAATQEAQRIARIKDHAVELLAALEVMVKTFGNTTVLSDYGRGVVAQANTAIAKAKGL